MFFLVARATKKQITLFEASLEVYHEYNTLVAWPLKKRNIFTGYFHMIFY